MLYKPIYYEFVNQFPKVLLKDPTKTQNSESKEELTTKKKSKKKKHPDNTDSSHDLKPDGK